VLLLALFSGGVSVVMAHVYLKRLETELSGGPKVAVLVAADDLPVGTVLGRAHVKLREVPLSYVDRRYVKATEAKKALGVRVSTGLNAADAVLWTDLGLGGNDGRELSRLVQHGMRAIHVQADDLFDGLLRPGDRVDVLFSALGADNQTQTLLQNLLVLCVDGDTGASEDAGGAARARGNSVTLSVTAEQAQLVTQAEQHGRLRLVVRNADDIVLVEGLPTTRLEDVQKASDRLRWQPSGKDAASAQPTREIDHVQ
jgi:pilus assembly protein CpaB